MPMRFSTRQDWEPKKLPLTSHVIQSVGALLRVVDDGFHFPCASEAHTVSANASGGANEIIIFIVTRSDNTLLLGGIAEDRVGNTDLTVESEVIQDIRKRCIKFMPCIDKAPLHPSYPVAVGLRPFRKGNVWVERELRRKYGSNGSANKATSRIAHSYGQGGAVWTLAYGCAADTMASVEEALTDIPPRPLMSV